MFSEKPGRAGLQFGLSFLLSDLEKILGLSRGDFFFLAQEWDIVPSQYPQLSHTRPLRVFPFREKASFVGK